MDVCLPNWKWRFKLLTSLMYFFHLQTGLNSNYTGAQDLWECMAYLFQLLCKESSTSIYKKCIRGSIRTQPGTRISCTIVSGLVQAFISWSNSGNTALTQPLEISIFVPPFCGERRAFNLENWTSYIELLTLLLQFLTIPEFRLWAIYVLYW